MIVRRLIFSVFILFKMPRNHAVIDLKEAGLRNIAVHSCRKKGSMNLLYIFAKSLSFCIKIDSDSDLFPNK